MAQGLRATECRLLVKFIVFRVHVYGVGTAFRVIYRNIEGIYKIGFTATLFDGTLYFGGSPTIRATRHSTVDQVNIPAPASAFEH